MFQVGDKISYPMHGAGRVEGIEEKEVLGNVGMYYVLYFYCDGMKVMIPVDRAEAAGLRPVIREEECRMFLTTFRRARERGAEQLEPALPLQPGKAPGGQHLFHCRGCQGALCPAQREGALSGGEEDARQRPALSARRALSRWRRQRRGALQPAGRLSGRPVIFPWKNFQIFMKSV